MHVAKLGSWVQELQLVNSAKFDPSDLKGVCFNLGLKRSVMLRNKNPSTEGRHGVSPLDVHASGSQVGHLTLDMFTLLFSIYNHIAHC